MIVISKMREQYSTGHVADDLARQYAEQQSVYGQYLRKALHPVSGPYYR